MSPFELFEHTADLGLRVSASDLDGLFREAAEGLFAMIVEALPDDAPRVERRFDVAGGRRDHLLVDWLCELLFVFESERLLFDRFEVQVGPSGLTARAMAQPLDRSRHNLLHEVKAITYHRLRVSRVGPRWEAEVIVDI